MDDNARKFVTDPIEIEKYNAISYLLIVDWLNTEENTEKKIVCKKSDSGEEYVLIEKVTINGYRTSEKQKIDQLHYDELKKSSIMHLTKKRFEFNVIRNDALFKLKYDVFSGGKLHMLEVDAATKEERDAFRIESFKGIRKEVTGDPQYQGYRIIGII